MRKKQTSVLGRGIEFLWNVVGGSMVVSMVAGVAYVLLASVFSQVHGIDAYWETKYFIRFFVPLLLVYLFLPALFTRMLGGLIGLTSNSRKNRAF